jgi:hypothetical protein
MSNTNVAPKATLAMSSMYQDRKADDPMFGLQVGTDGWFVANKNGKPHMLHSGGGNVKTLTMTWPQDIQVRRVVIYNRDRGCGKNDLNCAKRIIGASIIGTNTKGENTLTYTIPDLRSVYVMGDACNSYDWPPSDRGSYEQTFRQQISACFGQGGCLNAETGACVGATTPAPVPITTTAAPAPDTTSPAPQLPFAGRPLVKVIQELQLKYPEKQVMALEERLVETARLDFRTTIVVVWRQMGNDKVVRQVMGLPGGGGSPPDTDETTPAPTCPPIEDGTTVLDGTDGQLYRFENNALRPYMTQDIYRSWGSPQYKVFPKAVLDACYRGPAMSMKETTPAPATPDPTAGQDPTVYVLIHGPTYDESGTLRVLTIRFNTIGLQVFNQRDPAQAFVVDTEKKLIRNLAGGGKLLASNDECLAPMTSDSSDSTGVSVQWSLRPTGSHQYSYLVSSACGRSLFADAEDARVITLEEQGSPFYVVPVGRLGAA